MRIRFLLSLFAAIGLTALHAAAQTNIAGAYANGQVFLRWDLAPAGTISYDVYISVLPQSSTNSMTLVGQLFTEEATGARIHNLRPNATLRIPNGAGGYVTLTSTQGACAWTPHQAGVLYFAVVAHGSTAVTTDNRVRVAFNYDPVNDPVIPHLQLVGANSGHPYELYMVWIDGRVDPSDARPDFFVGGNEHRQGVPHLFAVTRPTTGLSAGPYPAVFCLHGGEGAWPNFMPGDASAANLALDMADGIVITPDDNEYWLSAGTVQDVVTQWFGYVPSFDPFFTGARTNPPATDLIVNYTSRRVFWIHDWLLSSRSPYHVDPHHVALIGHSAGSRGASHLSRQQPDRFSAVVLQCALINFSESTYPINPFTGTWTQNLGTNINDPVTGQPVHYRDIHTQYFRLSPRRDFIYTRMYSGKRDENDSGGWTPAGRAVLDGVNASRMGIIVNWDEREHGCSEWSIDSNDQFDDPAHCNPWPDAGQWITPIRSERDSAAYLSLNYRNDQSYPGIFDADSDLNAAGRQPDPGPGDPCSPLGTPYGTWGGYIDWENDTLVDTPARWECTLYLRGSSTTIIDNAPYAAELVSLAPRRTQRFSPAPGATVYWALRVPAYGQIVQHGQTMVDPDGAAYVTNLLISREDIAKGRIYLSTTLCLADFNGDASVDLFDYLDFVMALAATAPESDFNTDGVIDLFDYLDFLQAFSQGCR